VEVIPAAPLAVNSLDDIRVVPNPYKVRAAWESEPGERRISFTGLSQQCTIRIYNVAGEMIKKIDHTNGSSYEFWEVRNNDDQEIAPGLYFFHVLDNKLGEKIGKLVIIL